MQSCIIEHLFKLHEGMSVVTELVSSSKRKYAHHIRTPIYHYETYDLSWLIHEIKMLFPSVVKCFVTYAVCLLYMT